MTFDEWIAKMRAEHKVPFGTAYELFAREAWNASAEAERAACVSACEAAEDTGNATGIERDVTIWNNAVAYCVRRIKECANG